MSTLPNVLKGKRTSFLYFSNRPWSDFSVLHYSYPYGPPKSAMDVVHVVAGVFHEFKLRMALTTPMKSGGHYQRRKYPLGMAYTLRKASIR